MLRGLAVGIVDGPTGMGGGTLMTPMLVFFFFGVNPLDAVSSDLDTTAIMKPFGEAVHAHRGTVNRGIVGWLALGSMPSAFLGVLALRGLGDAPTVDDVGTIALVVAALALAYVSTFRRAKDRATVGVDNASHDPLHMKVRPLLTVPIGVVGVLVVGRTSVGFGSLIIIALMLLYPRPQASHLVGSDLIQAVLLVAAAAVGYVLFNHFRLAVTGVPNIVTDVVPVACAILGSLVWMGACQRPSLPAVRRQHYVLSRVDRQCP